MIDTKKGNLYQINYYVSLTIFSIISFCWLWLYNRYHVIQFMEDTQLFRSEIHYFNTYLAMPGGLTMYLANFFTQFYYYHVLGAAILTLSILLIVVLLGLYCGRKSLYTTFFLLPLGLAFLLLFASVDVDVRLYFHLGMIIALILSALYKLVNSRLRYLVGVLLYLACYFVAGGNVIIFLGLLILLELKQDKIAYPYLVGMLLLAISVPYIAYNQIYYCSLKEAFLSVTPFVLKQANLYLTVVWFALIFIPVIIFCLSKLLKDGDKIKTVLILPANHILIIVLAVWGINKNTDEVSEYVSGLAYYANNADWDKVLDLAEDIPKDQPDFFVPYFINMALSEKEQLLSEMFKYDQEGVPGLFPAWRINYQNFEYASEMYYNLGIVPMAEHTAFESMVLTPYEHGAKSLKRLVQTSMLRGADREFYKYIRFFYNSPIYENWAQEQRKTYLHKQIGKLVDLPDMPEKVQLRDAFMNYPAPLYNLGHVMNLDSTNKKVFEYIVAYVLLGKDLQSLEYILDKYYANIHYSEMPRYCQEAVVLASAVVPSAGNILNKYQVSGDVIEKFRAYAKQSELVNQATGKDELKVKFGDTYWFYYQYKIPYIGEQNEAVKPIY